MKKAARLLALCYGLLALAWLAVGSYFYMV